MSPGNGGLKKVYLAPGELYATSKPSQVVVVLGSCVSIILYCRRRGISTVCHAQLPSGPPGNVRFVDAAIRWMREWFAAQDIRAPDLEVSLFGGGDMFGPISKARKTKTVGRQNIERALDVIKAEGLILSRGDVGGRIGRKILFNTQTGNISLSKSGDVSSAIRRFSTLPEEGLGRSGRGG